MALGADYHRGAAFGGEHHDSHNALAVHLEIVALQGDLAAKCRRGFYDGRSRARVLTVLVDNYYGALNHHNTAATSE
jgi:hypothetical protein